MKKLIYISFLFFITSCNSQDKKENNKTINKPQPVKHTTMNNEYDYKKLISSKTEYFDIKYFDEHKDEAENLIYIDNNGAEVNIFGDIESGYISNSTPKNSLFTIYKEYNPKGIIMRKWVNFRNGGGPVGMKYEYDDSGKLIKETDMDKNYKIAPQDVISFCKEKGIDLFSNYTTIERNYNENPMDLYIINYRGEYEGKFGTRIIIVLSGTTGEIQKVTCINGKHNDSVEVLYDIQEEKKKSAQIYKTHQGVSYTRSEWETFEEKQYEEYCKRTGKPYTPKNLDTKPEHQDNKKSFLARDNDQGDENTPKKNKGFLGGLFS